MRSTRCLLPAAGALACLLSVGWTVLYAESPERHAAFDVPHPAPPMALRSIDGRTISSSDLRGKVVVLEIWATWCDKCFSEIPALDRLHRDRKGAGVEVVGVAVRSDLRVAALVEKRMGLDYPAAMSSVSFEDDFGPVWGLPMTLLLDRQWRVRKSWVGSGPDKEAEILELVDRLIAEPHP